MKSLTARVGLWSSMTGLLCFLVYVFAFAGIAIANPPFVWTDIDAFVLYNTQYSQFLKYLAMTLMLVYGISFVAQIVCLGEYARPEKRLWARLAALFALGFAVLAGINYFIQVTAVRLQIESGQYQGLTQFVMSYPVSAAAAVNMLGWTVFSGISSLFISFSLGITKREKACKWSFFANGVVMLLGCAGYVVDCVPVVFLCMYLGLGATVFACTLSQCFLYRERRS